MAKKNKNEKTVKQWDNVKETVENGAIEIFKDIMAKNFPKLMKYNKLQIQEAQRISSSINTTKPKQSQTYLYNHMSFCMCFTNTTIFTN